jgi:hypothetical protein
MTVVPVTHTSFAPEPQMLEPMTELVASDHAVPFQCHVPKLPDDHGMDLQQVEQ